MMKMVIATLLLLGAIAGWHPDGDAAPLRTNERYCIEMAEQGGGAGAPQCMFETLAQCITSKTSPSDRCLSNPRLMAGERSFR
jgi:hypothetical protein